MSIDFFHRLHRLVKADAHGLIESLEDRALLLKQHLREAELELQRKRARHGALEDEERGLREDLARLEQTLQTLDEDTRLALAGGREDLARFAIRKLIPTRSEIAAILRRIDDLVEERGRIGEVLERQESEFEALRTRVRAGLAERARAAEDESLFEAPLVADEEIEFELMRRMRAEGGTC